MNDPNEPRQPHNGNDALRASKAPGASEAVRPDNAPDDGANEALRADNIVKRFGAVTALDGVSLSLRRAKSSAFSATMAPANPR